MKDSNIKSKLYNFSILDSQEELERESDLYINKIRTNSIDEEIIFMQVLYNKFQEISHKKNSVELSIFLTIYLEWVLDHYPNHIQHIKYIKSIINDIIINNFNENIFKLDDSCYTKFDIGEKSYTLHKIIKSILNFVVFANMHIVDGIIYNKYSGNDIYDNYMNIMKYRIDNFSEETDLN